MGLQACLPMVVSQHRHWALLSPTLPPGRYFGPITGVRLTSLHRHWASQWELLTEDQDTDI